MKNTFRISGVILLILTFILIHSCKKEEPTSPITSTDIDGNVYHTLAIGTQVWMVENLKTTKYRNGDLIGTTSPYNKDIAGEAAPRYQWAYNGDESNVATYGRLYTWYAITDIRNICPTGWHVPSDSEWTTLENYLIANGFNYDGTSIGNKIGKALASNFGWTFSTDEGAIGNTDYPTYRNKSGFTALAGGYRGFGGAFFEFGYTGFWFTTDADALMFIGRVLGSNSSGFGSGTGGNNRYGASVRCLKDF